MKKFSKLLLAAGLAVALPFQVLAADAKIGVIDLRAIIANSPQAKSAMEKLKNEFKAREEKIVALDKTIKEKTEKFQRNSSIMSEAEKSKLEKEVIAGQRELQRLQTEFREDASSRQQEETKKILERINAVVEDVAKKENYDLVIHKEAASYSTKAIDLTDKVMKAVTQ